MGALADGLHADLRAAALADLEVELGRFADDDVVRPDLRADGAGGHALKALLVHHAGHMYAAGKIAPGLLGKGRRRAAHGGDRALHIRRAAAIDAAVFDLPAKRVVLPGGRVRPDGIDMPVQQQRRPGPLDAAVRIDAHLIKTVLFEKLRQRVHHAALLAGIAPAADERLRERDQDLLAVHKNERPFPRGCAAPCVYLCARRHAGARLPRWLRARRAPPGGRAAAAGPRRACR